MDTLKKIFVGGASNKKNKKLSHQKTVVSVENNSPIVQNLILIWLDENIDEKTADYCHTIAHLRRAVRFIHIFTDSEQCIAFLQSLENEQVSIIISGALGQHVIPKIHDMSQINTIFIFCRNKVYHEEWAHDWRKIQGVHIEINSICDALNTSVQQHEHNNTAISFMETTNDFSKKDLNQLDATFMYTQIVKDILLNIEFNQQHITEFIEYCHHMFENNEEELKQIQQFYDEYHTRTAIWWYTGDSFLYPMVNRALRVMDGDLIIKIGFFISALHQDIEQLHKKQFSNVDACETLTLYRGQGMTKSAFNKLTQTQGGLISFNNFLSTSKNSKVSYAFAKSAVSNSDLVGVMFVMTVDPRQSTTPFVSVADVGCFGDNEEEVLFSMHTVFRIEDVTPLNEDLQLFQVKLTLTNDNDKDLGLLTDRIREEAKGYTGWDQLGQLLIKVGQPAKAQQIYENLMKQSTTEIDNARFYQQLGWTKYKMGEHHQALPLLQQALKIQKKILPSNHPDLATTYSRIGIVYANMSKYSKAVSYNEKALAIQQQLLPPNHPDVALSHNTIGNAYYQLKQYSKALSSHEKALHIRQQSLPSNHPKLADSYTNIGLVYCALRDYTKALQSHEKSLEIQQQSLPPNHPDLALSYNNIGWTYQSMGDYTKAYSSYERAMEIGKQTLPLDHPHMQWFKNNLDRLQKKL